MKQLTFKIPDELARAFRVLAAKEDSSMSALLVRWIKEHTPASVRARDFTQEEVDGFVAADEPPAAEIKAWLRKK